MAEAENEVPLLTEEMLLYPNCPGCKCAHLRAKGAGPPVKELLLTSIVVLCNAVPISSLFPFLYFMVEDFHIAKMREDIGYYAGAIGSVFMFGRFLSAVPWGVFADKYGRRPVMIVGLLSIIIFQTLFGLCGNFWLALLTRFLLGAFNGMLGPIKAYASELCNAESQAWGLTAVSTSWSFGLIVGPALGGFLARPAVNYPGHFSEDSLFARYPYLLPSLPQAVFALCALAVVHYLPETIHKHDEGDCHAGDVEQTLVQNEKIEQRHQKRSLWLNWPLMASVSVYCVWSLQEISFAEVFSLWAVSPVETDGLGLQTSDLGVILAVSGFGMMFVQLGIFPPLAKRLRPSSVTWTNALLVVPLVILFPFVASLHGQLKWIALNVLAVLRNSLSTMVTTGSFILVNNSVSTEQRGAANGISLSCVSLFRTIGPASAGAVFSWGQSRHNAKFLPGSKMVFCIIDVICVLALLTMGPPFLPKSVNEPYTNPNAPPSSKPGLESKSICTVRPSCDPNRN